MTWQARCAGGPLSGPLAATATSHSMPDAALSWNRKVSRHEAPSQIRQHLMASHSTARRCPTQPSPAQCSTAQHCGEEQQPSLLSPAQHVCGTCTIPACSRMAGTRCAASPLPVLSACCPSRRSSSPICSYADTLTAQSVPASDSTRFQCTGTALATSTQHQCYGFRRIRCRFSPKNLHALRAQP